MCRSNRAFLFFILLATFGTSGAFAQCSETRINDAFRLAPGRAPGAPAECDANRYAGGAFSGSSDLVPLLQNCILVNRSGSSLVSTNGGNIIAISAGALLATQDVVLR